MRAHARQEQAEADNRFIQMLEETTAVPTFPPAALRPPRPAWTGATSARPELGSNVQIALPDRC
jgi:hypothetical protein